MLPSTKALTKQGSGDRLITKEKEVNVVTDNSKPSESWRRKATSLNLPDGEADTVVGPPKEILMSIVMFVKQNYKSGCFIRNLIYKRIQLPVFYMLDNLSRSYRYQERKTGYLIITLLIILSAAMVSLYAIDRPANIKNSESAQTLEGLRSPDIDKSFSSTKRIVGNARGGDTGVRGLNDEK